jgi:hypothetical protein
MNELISMIDIDSFYFIFVMNEAGLIRVMCTRVPSRGQLLRQFKIYHFMVTTIQ